MSEKKKLIALKIAKLLIKCAMAIMQVIEQDPLVVDKSCLEQEVLPTSTK